MEVVLKQDHRVLSIGEFRTWAIEQAAKQGKQIVLPDTLTTELLDSLGAEPVMEGAQPVPGDYQSVQRDGIETVTKNERAWHQTKYKLVDWSAEQIAAFKAQAREQKWEAIKATRDKLKAAGVKVGSHWLHSDTDSRIQWLGLKDTARDMLDSGAALNTSITMFGTPILWKTMAGVFIPVTVQLALDVVQKTKELDAHLFQVAEQHRINVMATDLPHKYDTNTDWPKTFGE